MSELVLDNVGWVAATPPRWLKRVGKAAALLMLAWAMLTYLPGPMAAFFIGPIDKVLVDKSARTISLMRDGKAVFAADISLGKNPTGQKQREGDQRTPEGKYKLIWGNDASTHHKALLVSYPNKVQASRAAAKGEAAGGGIMIHGQRQWWRYFTRSPLTNGCVGVSNLAMDVIWSAVDLGTPIEIRP